MESSSKNMVWITESINLGYGFGVPLLSMLYKSISNWKFASIAQFLETHCEIIFHDVFSKSFFDFMISPEIIKKKKIFRCGMSEQ